MQKKKTETSEEYYGELGRLFYFTRGDLEANRAGFLSHRQKEFQKRSIVISYIVGFGIIGLILVVGIGFTFYMSARQFSCPSTYCPTLILLLVGLCVTPITLLFFWLFFVYFKDGQAKGRVEKLVSRLGVDKVETKHPSYQLVSYKYRFEIFQSQYEYPYGNLPYVVYFLPYSRTIVSIEVLTEEG